jgi:hypothetical protein
LKKMPLTERVEHRVCWSCEHLYFFAGSPGYSELTPGDDFSMECGKDYWRFENYDDGLTEFRAKLQSAEVCGSFKERVVQR